MDILRRGREDIQMKPIEATRALFIKLGTGGEWRLSAYMRERYGSATTLSLTVFVNCPIGMEFERLFQKALIQGA